MLPLPFTHDCFIEGWYQVVYIYILYHILAQAVVIYAFYSMHVIFLFNCILGAFPTTLIGRQ